MLSNRTFGVEIECGHDQLDDDDIADLMQGAGFKVGDYEAGKDHYGYTDDGSGIEIKTPILKGKSGYKEIFRIMDFLNDMRCYVSRRDGMHVHIGAAMFARNEKACARLARSWYSNQGVIERMCASHRRDWGACARITERESKVLGQTQELDSYTDWTGRKYTERIKEWGGRKSLNFTPLEEDHGTIEFRLHEGCLDPVRAVAWIKFCQKFVDYAANERKPLTCARSKSALLTTLGVPNDAIAILAKPPSVVAPDSKIRMK